MLQEDAKNTIFIKQNLMKTRILFNVTAFKEILQKNVFTLVNT